MNNAHAWLEKISNAPSKLHHFFSYYQLFIINVRDIFIL